MAESDGTVARAGTWPDHKRPHAASTGSIWHIWAAKLEWLIRGMGQRLARTGMLARVLALVTLGLTIVSAGFVMLSAQSIRDSTARTLQERLLIAEAMAKSLDDRLLQIATVAALEAERLPAVGGEMTEATRAGWRGLRLQFGPMVERLVAIDSGGRVLWTTPYDETLLGLDLAGVPAVAGAFLAGKPVIGETGPSRIPSVLLGPSGTSSVSILSPVRSPRGGSVLVIVNLSQPRISDLFGQVVLGNTGYTEVVGRDGEVLASARPDRLGMASDHQGYFATLIDERNPVVGTCHDCHGGSTGSAPAEDVLAFAPLSQAPLAVAVRQSSGEAFAFGEALFQRALLFGAVSFFAALGLSWLIVVRLVRPVKALTDACQRIAGGDLSASVRPTGGGEIGILAGSFETMRTRLNASQEELRRWGSQLERMVSERTAELEDARDSFQRSRDFLVTLFDSLEDELAVIDGDYRVVDANRALLRRHGDGKRAEGLPCYRVFHGMDSPCDPQRGGCPVEAVWRTGQPSRATRVHLDVSGRVVYLDVIASPIRNGHGQVMNVLEVARDVTESKRLEEQVIRTSEELSTLVSLSSAIACSMDLQAMLGLALDHLLALMGSSSGGILVDGAEGEADCTVVARGLDAGEIARLAAHCSKARDCRRPRKARWKRSEILCVPIATRERVLGEMYISCPARPCSEGNGRQLLTSIGSQLAVAIENARLYEALRSKEAAISLFLRKYIAAQEEERKRIARELHDDTAQSLAALAMAIETALQKKTDSAAEVRSLLEPAKPLAQRVSGEIDRIIRDLRPSLLDDLGLVEALGWYADHRLRPLGIRVVFDADQVDRRLGPELETALFRVAQEAMSNVARHARAENVAISLEYGSGHVTLDVEDDGCGFDLQGTLARGDNGRDDSPFGLLGMRERVNLLGGTLSVDSRVGEGTSIRVSMPLRGEQP